jgi:hypothetical protein
MFLARRNRTAANHVGLLSPKGELFRCTGATLHAELARKIVANPKASSADILRIPRTPAPPGTDPNAALGTLLSKGWIRIADYSAGCIQVAALTNRVKALIDDFMLENKVFNTELNIGFPYPTRIVDYQVS